MPLPLHELPLGCRTYLEASVVPLLHQGMVELVAEVERQRLAEAAAVGLEDGMYLPRDWLPFSPFRYAWGTKAVLQSRFASPSPSVSNCLHRRPMHYAGGLPSG